MSRRRALVPVLTATAAGLLAASVGLATAVPAGAADLPVSQSRGFFLSGAVAGTDLAQAVELADANAVNTGGAKVVDANPLSATVLGQLTIPVGQVQVPIGQGLTFGALNQYAEASPDGSSTASSGAVADNGAIQTSAQAGTAGQMSLDLKTLAASNGLPAELTTLLAQLGDVQLTAGALAGQATRAPFGDDGSLGAASGKYQIGSLTLTLTGPQLVSSLISSLVTQATTLRDAVQRQIDAAEAALPTGGVLTVSGTLPDPATAFDGLTTISGPGYTADLATGTLTLDLAALIEGVTGVDINNQPPNTELVPLLVQALTAVGTDLTNQLDQQLQAKATAFADSLGGITVTVAGIPVPITGEALSTFIPNFSTLTGALGTGITTLTTALGTAFGQLGSALNQFFKVTINVQQTAADQTFTETALRLQVAPSGGGAVPTLLDLSLGSASVGPGTPVVATPPTPQGGPEVPVLANTGPAETLGTAAVGAWAVVAGVALTLFAGAARRRQLGRHRA